MAQRFYALIHSGDCAFGISFPDFPGCISGGETISEAIRRGCETLAFHARGMFEDGDELPCPRTLAELWEDPAFRGESEGAAIVSVQMSMPAQQAREET